VGFLVKTSRKGAGGAKTQRGGERGFHLLPFASLCYFFVHTEFLFTGAVVVYVPGPPEIYLITKSPISVNIVPNFAYAKTMALYPKERVFVLVWKNMLSDG